MSFDGRDGELGVERLNGSVVIPEGAMRRGAQRVPVPGLTTASSRVRARPGELVLASVLGRPVSGDDDGDPRVTLRCHHRIDALHARAVLGTVGFIHASLEAEQVGHR